MPVKYRKLFGPIILSIALSSAALVSVRMKTAAKSTLERSDAARLAQPPKSSEQSTAAVMPSSSDLPPMQGDP